VEQTLGKLLQRMILSRAILHDPARDRSGRRPSALDIELAAPVRTLSLSAPFVQRAASMLDLRLSLADRSSLRRNGNRDGVSHCGCAVGRRWRSSSGFSPTREECRSVMPAPRSVLVRWAGDGDSLSVVRDAGRLDCRGALRGS